MYFKALEQLLFACRIISIYILRVALSKFAGANCVELLNYRPSVVMWTLWSHIMGVSLSEEEYSMV